MSGRDRRSRSRGRDRSREARRAANRSRSREGRESRGDRDGGRDRDRERRDRSRDRRRRTRSRSDSRRRSRSRDRRRKRASNWDVGPTGGAAPPVPQTVRTGAFTQMSASATFGNKRSREIWIGNLVNGAVTPQHLKEFFTQMLNALPEYQAKYAELVKDGKSPVRDVQMTNNSAYAFVEFWTEELAATACEFNQVEFMGRPMKIERPQGFTVVGNAPVPLDCGPLRQAGLMPALGHMITSAVVASTPAGPMPSTSRKQRELYFGNLPVGQLTADSMRQLLTPACELLPDFNASLGSPIVNVTMNEKFCFVEFQNDKLCTAALPIFNGMEIFGRKMNVARPAGYVDPAGGIAGIPGLPGLPAPNLAPLAPLASIGPPPGAMAPMAIGNGNGPGAGNAAMAAGALAVEGLNQG